MVDIQQKKCELCKIYPSLESFDDSIVYSWVLERCVQLNEENSELRRELKENINKIMDLEERIRLGEELYKEVRNLKSSE